MRNVLTFQTSVMHHGGVGGLNVAESSRALIKHADLLCVSRKSFVKEGTSAKKRMKLVALSGVVALWHGCW